MPDNEDEEFYPWIVMFRRGDVKLYTYMHRSVAEMADIVRRHYDRRGHYPYRVWVIVDDEIQKVVIA